MNADNAAANDAQEDVPRDVTAEEFGRFLAWYDDQLLAGNDVEAGSLPSFSEGLEQATAEHLEQFEAAIRLLQFVHGPQADPSGGGFSDGPLGSGVSMGVIPTEQSAEVITDAPGEAGRENITPGKAPPKGVPLPGTPATANATSVSATAGSNTSGSSRYQLIRLLGFGGHGIAMLAWDRLLGIHVAIKTPQTYRSPGPKLSESFQREAQWIARLNHRGIVRIYDLLLNPDGPVIVMEYCEGGSLADWIGAHPGTVPAKTAARAAAELARALHEVHRLGIIHRDLKPGNILLSRPKSDNRQSTSANSGVSEFASDLGHWDLKLTDFGLATAVTFEGEGSAGRARAVGTSYYMSPEQIEGRMQEIGPASDIYGLGVLLYQLVTGVCPHTGSTRDELRLKVTKAPYPPAGTRNPSVPTDLDRIIERCLAKQPSDRYRTAEDLARQLDAFLADRPVEGLTPPTRLDRGWKWLASNRLKTTLAITLTLLALVGVWYGPETVTRSRIEWEWREKLGHQWSPVPHPGFQPGKLVDVQLNPRRKGLEISTDAIRLVELGRSTDGNFDFSIDIENVRQVENSGAGIFWGYHEQHTLVGLPACQFQSVWMSCTRRGDGPLFLQLRHWIMGIRSDRNQILPNGNPSSLDLEFMVPHHAQRLQIQVQEGILVGLVWDGTEYIDLIPNQFTRAKLARDSDPATGRLLSGPFGVFAVETLALFSNPSVDNNP